MEPIGRREYLLASGAVGTAALAGCLTGNDDSADTGDDASEPNGDEPSSEPDGDDSGTRVENGAADGTDADDSNGDETDETTASEQLRATLHTTEGDIEVLLYPERVPETVANFVGLARGERAWVHPETGETREDPLYENILFHRVIDGFMIQTGDPLGTGVGGPGYTFADEFHPELRHDSPGVLSMANRGPDTNGSQFFITLDAQPHLDGAHAVFGNVVDGMQIVETIGSAETDSNDRPVEEIRLNSVLIHDQV